MIMSEVVEIDFSSLRSEEHGTNEPGPFEKHYPKDVFITNVTI